MNHDSTPVTHAQLSESLATLRDEMQAMHDELSRDMKTMHDELSRDMKTMHDDLLRELAQHVTASAEQTQALIIGLDDRYRDLPGRVAVLERTLDEHRTDTTLHPTRRRRR